MSIKCLSNQIVLNNKYLNTSQIYDRNCDICVHTALRLPAPDLASYSAKIGKNECDQGKCRPERQQQCEDLEAGANCLDCNERLGTHAKCIECDNYSNWICLNCSGLSKAKFEAISEEPDDMIWFCRHCRIALPGMKNILKAITKMEDKHEALALSKMHLRTE